MQIVDLQKIAHLAHTQSLPQTAKHFNITPGALSKTLKKVESTLKTELFDRIGRHIELNSNGRRFVSYTRHILHEYQQMCSEFSSNHSIQKVKCSGPSILLTPSMALLLQHLPSQAEVEFDIQFEGNIPIIISNYALSRR